MLKVLSKVILLTCFTSLSLQAMISPATPPAPNYLQRSYDWAKSSLTQSYNTSREALNTFPKTMYRSIPTLSFDAKQRLKRVAILVPASFTISALTTQTLPTNPYTIVLSAITSASLLTVSEIRYIKLDEYKKKIREAMSAQSIVNPKSQFQYLQQLNNLAIANAPWNNRATLLKAIEDLMNELTPDI